MTNKWPCLYGTAIQWHHAGDGRERHLRKRQAPCRNPLGNKDNWSLYGGDRRFTWCPNDAQCIETVQLSASQGYGNDLFGGQHDFSPADAFTANGRTIDAYVRLMQGATCPAGMCPEGRFADTAPHWVEFGIAGTQLTVAAAVPEPETCAMLLAGLGLVGFAARHRIG